MSYRSLIRSVGTVVRQAERDSIRRQKALQQQQAAYSRMQELEKAAYDVEVYENYIDRITSLHKDCISNYDWSAIIQQKPPVKPDKISKRELEARKAIDNFKPTFFDKLLKSEDKKWTELDALLQNAITDDTAEYNNVIKKYNIDFIEYNELMDLANRVNQGDTSSYQKVIDELEPLSEISGIGSQFAFEFTSSNRMKVIMTTHDQNIVPKESKSLLKSGKISIKELPVGKHNEIYQDYVCSAAIRVAREIFGLLPVEEVIVTSKSKLLNKSTGRLEDQAILSVRFIKDTINTLNFADIDPSDSMTNFIHNMGFKKSLGMSPVEEIDFT